jgi:ABC-type branched-subunit amino acid transport system ATPase component/branched-subunit amino acid ABC-type transport system permease component
MMEILRFVLLGIGTGGVYAMLAQGLVLVYRGSGLLNFSQGALAMTGAFVYYECTSTDNMPRWAGLVIALAACGLLGAVIQLAVLKHMRHSSALSRVIATLGITIVLQSAAYLRYGHDPHAVKSLLPTTVVHVFSSQLSIQFDLLAVFVIGLALTVVLAVSYRRTAFGRITTAVAEKQRVAATLGHSPDLVASVNWALGGMIAALGGILVAPILYLEPTQLVLLVLPAMCAALLGGFVSFPVTFAVAVALGIAESLIGRYVSQVGWSSAAPFIVVVVVLIIRGQVLPQRSHVLDRLPAVGSGRVRYPVVIALYAVAAYLTLSANLDWATAIATNVGLAILCLSVVVITGYAGQLSLAQAVIGGVGALVAAKVASDVPFIVAVIVGAIAAAGAGALIGLPALRTRGVTLAIATLGLASGLVSVVLTNVSYTGGQEGIFVRSPAIFGWQINPLFHANRYAFVALTIMVLLGIAIANLRRGATGRRLLALRSNERAAAALGLPGSYLKAYAFALAAAIAGVGGVLLAFGQPTVVFNGTTDNFSVYAGVLVIAMTVAGGVGSVGGALLGSLLLAGGVLSQLFSAWPSINDYLPLIGGLGLIAMLIQGPDGLFEYNRQQLARLGPAWGRITGPVRRPRRAPRPADVADEQVRITPKALAVSGLSVSFGGINALHDVELTVEPGQVHGLIGPNGAGKTTLIDAITGFVKAKGSVQLGGVDVAGRSPRLRARAGISRSFQSLELFSDLTVAENLVVASERHRPYQYLTDLVWPRRPRLSGAALEAIRQFELTELIEQKPDSISFGRRKTVAIARAIAAAPSVLLLDEPAAGLNDHEAAELARLIRMVASEWNIGVLLVEHKVDMVMSISDHVTVLTFGEVLASGTPAEIMAERAVIDAYLGTASVAAIEGERGRGEQATPAIR